MTAPQAEGPGLLGAQAPSVQASQRGLEAGGVDTGDIGRTRQQVGWDVDRVYWHVASEQADILVPELGT
jgi:hypothetical protein